MVVKSYDRGVPRVIHVLWAPQAGPICAYDNPSLAWTHARTMLGVEVSGIEIRAELPDVVRNDLGSEYDEDEPTPVSIEDIDDGRLLADDE